MATIVLDDEDIRQAQSVLNDCCALRVPLADVRRLLDADDRAKAEIAKWGANDTEVRSDIAAAALTELGIQKRWPRYGDTEEYKREFHQEFNAAARERGWLIESLAEKV